MTQQLMKDLEACLRLIRENGGWTTYHDEILDRWRAARGIAAKTGWSWWARKVGEELYEEEFETRDAAIAWGVKNLEPQVEFELIEARCWADDIEGDEASWFAESRNHTIIPGSDGVPA